VVNIFAELIMDMWLGIMILIADARIAKPRIGMICVLYIEMLKILIRSFRKSLRIMI